MTLKRQVSISFLFHTHSRVQEIIYSNSQLAKIPSTLLLWYSFKVHCNSHSPMNCILQAGYKFKIEQTARWKVERVSKRLWTFFSNRLKISPPLNVPAEMRKKRNRIEFLKCILAAHSNCMNLPHRGPTTTI